MVSIQSFSHLINPNSMTDDTIITSFLIRLCYAVPNTSFVDTNFSRNLQRVGWKPTYQKYFLHSTSSSYTRRCRQKPTLESETILIPYRIHGSHWVAIARRIVNREILFLYADDLNSAQTEESSKPTYLLTTPPYNSTQVPQNG
jgi:hypothetical protein